MPFTSYRATPDADARHLYRDVPVAIDPARLLNNGMPSVLAFLIDALAVREGEHVLHVGCGTGYYSAILAGRAGRITALETDEDLASRARQDLASLRCVEVVHADGRTHDAGPSDAILSNAGATHPQPMWLDSLGPGGRLVFPLTRSSATGSVVKVTRTGAEFAARGFFQVMMFPSIGARDVTAIARVDAALAQGQPEAVRSLRRDSHEPEAECWLHGDGRVALGSVPDLDFPLYLTLVDVVAAAIVRSLGTGDVLGRVIDLLGSPRTRFRDLVVAVRRAGRALVDAPYADWRRHLAEARPQSALYPLLAPLPDDPHEFVGVVTFAGAASAAMDSPASGDGARALIHLTSMVTASLPRQAG